MPQFPDFERDRDDDPIRQPAGEAPFEGVSVAAGLQGTASLIYVVSVLFIVFLSLVASSPGPGDRSVTFVLAFLCSVGMCLNWIFSLVAAAMLTFANTGARGRGVGAALLVFSYLCLMSMRSMGQVFEMGGGPLRGLGGPFGGLGGGRQAEMFLGFNLIYFAIYETTRLSLIGWYVAAAAPPGRSGLSGAGKILGILTPVLLALALLMSFLLSLAFSGSGDGKKVLGIMLLMGNLSLFVGLVIFGAALMLRLGSAVKARRRTIDY